MASHHYVLAIALFSIAATANAATPEIYAKLDKASEAACIKAANLNEPRIGPSIRFSDRAGVDARVLEGTWPQPHMKGAKARMLCLYNRKNKRTEVQELMLPPAEVASVKDVWWRAEDIGGKGVIDSSEITLMLGSDGKIGGRSGCNGYSANYQITGENIKVYPPVIGTRMACAPALMNQEQSYRSLIEAAQSFTLSTEGKLQITSTGGVTSRFVRK